MTPERTFGVIRQPLLLVSFLSSYLPDNDHHQFVPINYPRVLRGCPALSVQWYHLHYYFAALPSGIKGDHVWLGSSIYAIEVKWRAMIAWSHRVFIFYQFNTEPNCVKTSKKTSTSTPTRMIYLFTIELKQQYNIIPWNFTLVQNWQPLIQV